MANTTTLQSVVSNDLAAKIERTAESRGLTVSAFIRDVLRSTIDTEGTFFGVTMCRAATDHNSPTARWMTVALPYEQVDVIDGALVFRNASGAIGTAVGPGRWRECSRRHDIDRGLFTASDVVDDQALKREPTPPTANGVRSVE